MCVFITNYCSTYYEIVFHKIGLATLLRLLGLYFLNFQY